MPDDSQLLVVSNRLPVQLERGSDGFEYRPTAGGLATALSTARDRRRFRWLGWPGIHVEDEAERRAIGDDLAEHFDAIPLFVPEATFEAYYSGFSNGTIWPLFHYFPQYAHYAQREWDAYHEVNRLFRDRILEIASPDERVWIHDYHLLLLPQLLREARPEARIGFFLHIPFPSSELFRMLPWREEILHGLLGADLVGFHSHGYARHFESSLMRLLGLEHEFGRVTMDDREVQIDTFPLGIDVDKFSTATESPQVKDELQRLRQQGSGRKIVLTVDRLDFTKGIPERLRMFERFLEENPQWHGRVILIALIVPSRTGVPEYQALKHDVDKLVGQVNGRFGEPGWVPIWYLYRSLPFERLVALYRAADVALVTPLRDGMNLVAKEFLASHPEHAGVLILSETAGAAEELGEALIVNPHDIEHMCRALGQALQMPETEQKHRNQLLAERQQRNSVMHWVQDFLTQLEPTAARGRSTVRLEGDLRTDLLDAYRRSQRRLLFLDYDGTMVPFAPRPEEATPDESLLEELRALTADGRNTVVIISGRERTTLEAWVGNVGAALVAEHGVFIRRRSDSKWRSAGQIDEHSWKAELRPLFELYVDRTPGALIEEKAASLAWHYRQVEPELGTLRARQLMDGLQGVISNTPLVMMQGSKVLEVRNSGAGKGRAAKLWLSRDPPYDFILATGDDPTDEELFEVMPDEAWTIVVGATHQSQARFSLLGATEMRRVLRAMA